MAENYTRVRKTKNQEDIQPNEIRITKVGSFGSYISYAVALLDPSLLKQDEQAEIKEQTVYDQIVLKGMGQTINKTVSLAEVIKRRVAGLHQINEIQSASIVDEFEPKTEGLERISQPRVVSVMNITLSKKPLDTQHVGYQAPIPADQVQPIQENAPKQKRSSAQRKATQNRKSAARKQKQQTEAAAPAEEKKKETAPASTSATSSDQAPATTAAVESGEKKKKKRAKRRFPKKPKQVDDTTSSEAATTTTASPATPTSPATTGESQEARKKKGTGKGRRPRKPRVNKNDAAANGEEKPATATTTETPKQE